MADKILKFFRYPDGSLQALVALEKTIVETFDKAWPPPKAGVSAADNEKEFFAAIQADVDARKKSLGAPVDDVEGKPLDQLPKF